MERNDVREVGEQRMTVITAADGPGIQQSGRRAVKRPNPVYLSKLAEPCRVQTNEGLLNANAGDFVAYDPISGHVWPVAASYVEQHYDVEPEA